MKERKLGWDLEEIKDSPIGNSTLGELVARYGDVVVTLGDSVAVGNCGRGSRSFLEQHFSGRASVTIADLVPLLPELGVREVIEHKLELAEARGVRDVSEREMEN